MPGEAPPGAVTLFLAGDVMLGRGVDQVLPHPGDPQLRERYAGDARQYVGLAEAVNGAIPRPADVAWPWGDVLALLDDVRPNVRVVNVETSITRSDDFAPGKPVHYRMSPGNVAGLAAVRPDVCVLANNHVLDFGRPGLVETLDTMEAAGLRPCGAGRDRTQASRPVVVEGGDRRVLTFAVGTRSSGIPAGWAADAGRPGVHLVDVTPEGAAELAALIGDSRRDGDVVVVSIHWGSNWGYDVPREHVDFAHRLIDGGTNVVHGHSSHHPRPIEVYRGKLVLYGCGDFIDDYEGIGGYEEYRDDLRLAYLASIEADSGNLTRLWMAPMRSRRFRLEPASPDESAWMGSVLDRISAGFGAGVEAALPSVGGVSALSLGW